MAQKGGAETPYELWAVIFNLKRSRQSLPVEQVVTTLN